MAGSVIALLIILWVLGIVRIPGVSVHDIGLFTIGRFRITLWDILVILVIMWAIEILPSPLREIAAFLVILWILSAFGLIVVSGLQNLIIIAVVVGLVASLFHKTEK